MTDTTITEVDGFVPKFIESFDGGINLAKRPNAIADVELLEASGVHFQEEQILIDTGYIKFGQVVVGKPRLAFQFFKRDGTSQLVLITTTRFYFYNGTNAEWELPSTGVKTTLVNNEIAAATVIEVVSDTDFADTDPVGITLDDGTQHQTTINGAPAANVITITDGLPSAASIGNALVQGLKLTGTDDIPISIDTWAASDKLYFANGIEPPKEYDATDVIDIQNLPGTTFTCRVVAVHNQYLHLLHTTEDGSAFPQRVRNSDTGDPTNWATGNAGFEDLYQREDFILDTAALGDHLIIYRERSIIRQEFVGQADLLFNRIVTIDGEGILNGDSIANLGDSHFIPGNSNFYEYFGTFDLNARGDKIRKQIYSQDGEADPAKTNRSFALYVEELDEVWFFYVKSGDTHPRRFLRYNVGDKNWASRDLAVAMQGYGFFQSTTAKTWQQLTGTWAEQTFTWNSKTLLASSPTILLCGNDNQVYEYDFLAGDDDGTAIPYKVVTGDFYIPNFRIRTDWFEFFAKGISILFEYSIDQGLTWLNFGTASPGVSFDRVRFYKQITAERIRFRWSGSGGGFGLEWFNFMWRQESAW